MGDIEHGPAVAKLTRVVVPPYLREKNGHVEDVSGYTYDRDRKTGRLVPVSLPRTRQGSAILKTETKVDVPVATQRSQVPASPKSPNLSLNPSRSATVRSLDLAIENRRRRKAGKPTLLPGGEVDRRGPGSGQAFGTFGVGSYTKEGPAPTRPISEIAAEIRRTWKNPNFAARPYLDAMLSLDKITDMYGADSAQSVISYFLANASQFRGEEAKRIKAELKALLKGVRPSMLTRIGRALTEPEFYD